MLEERNITMIENQKNSFLSRRNSGIIIVIIGIILTIMAVLNFINTGYGLNYTVNISVIVLGAMYLSRAKIEGYLCIPVALIGGQYLDNAINNIISLSDYNDTTSYLYDYYTYEEIGLLYIRDICWIIECAIITIWAVLQIVACVKKNKVNMKAYTILFFISLGAILILEIVDYSCSMQVYPTTTTALDIVRYFFNYGSLVVVLYISIIPIDKELNSTEIKDVNISENNITNSHNENKEQKEEVKKMKYCSHCGKEILDEAVVCPHCGCAVNGSNNAVIGDDIPSTGLNILSFLIPIVGLILYLTLRDREPKKATAAGKWALIGVGVGVGLVLLLTMCTASIGTLAYM